MAPMNDVTIERTLRAAQAPRLQALTGLRFFAVLLVVLHHFWRPSGPAPTGVPAFLWEGVGRLAAHGFIGVSLFFVLSGFVLAHTYDRPAQTLSRRRFWAARFARIYPMYLLALAVALPDLLSDIALLVAKHGATFGTAWGALKAVAVLALVQSWLPSFAMFWNGPAWSLSAEAFFYLLFPLLLATPCYRRLSPRGAIRGMVLLGALVLGMGIFLYALRLAHPGMDPYQVIGMAPIFRLPEFLAGMLLGRVFVRTGPFASRLGASLVGGLALVAFLLLNGGLAVPDELAIGLNLPLVVALVGGLAFGAGPVARLFSHRWAVMLGEASYGIYLLHVPIGNRCVEAAGTAHGYLRLDRFVAFLLATVVVACLLFRYYEDPLRRSLRRLLSGPAIRMRPTGPPRPGEGR